VTQIFPKWIDSIPKYVIFGIFVSLAVVVFIFTYWFSPWHLEVGYEPVQPISYSHKLHAGNLNIDCRYCHFNVEKSSAAGVPPTQICMNCHNNILVKSDKIKILVNSIQSNVPIEWVRVHKLPDYVYFDHSVHIHSGIGCISCHGEVNKMDRIKQVKPLSMSWCLDCHKNPALHVRPMDKITEMCFDDNNTWNFNAYENSVNFHPPVIGCSGCHR